MGFEVIEDLVEVTERDAQMRSLLPAAAVVALQAGRPKHLDREAEPERVFIEGSSPLLHSHYSGAKRRKTQRLFGISEATISGRVPRWPRGSSRAVRSATPHRSNRRACSGS